MRVWKGVKTGTIVNKQYVTDKSTAQKNDY